MQNVGIVDMFASGTLTNTANGYTSTCQYISIDIPAGFTTSMFSLYFKFEGTSGHQTSSLMVSIQTQAGELIYGQTVLEVEKTYDVNTNIYTNVVFPYYIAESATFNVVVIAESEQWDADNNILIYGGALDYTSTTSMPIYQLISDNVEIS